MSATLQKPVCGAVYSTMPCPVATEWGTLVNKVNNCFSLWEKKMSLELIIKL
jgi:hypothetical protein